MSIPDSIDEQLVKLLGKDARQNNETLAKQLTKMEGVTNSETFICLDMRKGRFVPLT